MTNKETSNLLQFFPFSSMIDPAFWHILANKKLETLKLDDSPIHIIAEYRNDEARDLPPLVNVNYEAFNENVLPEKGSHLMFGKLIVTNTIEDFINRDKKELIQSVANDIWNDIINDKVPLNPSFSLSKFLLIVYADMKSYKFHYWFSFPALCYPQKCEIISLPKNLSDVWDNQTILLLQSEVEKLNTEDQSYFFIANDDSKISVYSVKDYDKLKENINGKIIIGIADACTSDRHPGWSLRNMMAFVSYKYKYDLCQIICYRCRNKDIRHSLFIEVKIEAGETDRTPACVGWEKNESHKLLPRIANLRSVLDPIQMAENAIDLNLKLMRWRLVPSLNLNKIASTKCLILGSGTLGCYVARGLLAWGVRTITFVDNSTVSYSNPVRQSLFTFADCIDGGKPKAIAAAESLRLIFPNVNSVGIQLSIPMPGHPIVENVIDDTKLEVEKLTELIDAHDVLFLLMDTRESRWLPTVIGSAKQKLVINAALGFDTFLVLRHGLRNPNCSDTTLSDHSSNTPEFSGRKKKIEGSLLGCYFCNDVVAPGDSTKDRTLDQQCTVTRPGVSMFASALAIELMVSVLQHPLGGDAPALTVDYNDYDDTDVETSLGIVPHQIRGFLSRFQQLMPTCEKFDKCTACSDKIIHEYTKNGFDFLLKAFNESNYLEDLTGLKQLHNETNLEDIWTLSDTDDEN